MSDKAKKEPKKGVDLDDLNSKADIADAKARRAEAMVRYQVAMATLREMGKGKKKKGKPVSLDDM